MKWSLEEIELPLKFNWKLSRSETQIKHNFIVRLQVDELTTCGEVAFNTRYEESRERILKEFDEFSRDFPDDVDSVEDVMKFCSSRDFCKSLRFGVESAFVHYMALATDRSVPELLGVPFMSSAPTSFSLPILDISDIEDFILDHDLKRFDVLKVKVNKESALSTVETVFNAFSGKIRIDGNECWESAQEVLEFIGAISDLGRIEFLEQPIRSDCHNEAKKLRDLSPILLMADESLTSQDVTEYYAERFHAVNVKLMKAGSYMKAVLQLRQARELGLKTMVGCMIETSLGISSALNISYGTDFLDLDGCLLLKEDPFKLILEENGKLFRSDLH
jgi:glutamate racemase